MKKIGFVGVGVMGKAMVRNLMKNGFEVAVYTRTREKITDLLDEGACWCDDVATCAHGREAVITMVGYPKDVEQVYFGAEGILENTDPGSYVIDMTTTDPALSQRIFTMGTSRDLHVLDAPVSGGDVGAQNATLSIMVGGEKTDYEACMPVFEAMGKTIVYEGKAGAGQHTKMANQIALSGAIAGVCEAIAYAEKEGLNVETMLATISQGAAGSWQMSNNAPRMIAGDFAPGFYIKHYIKDLHIALQNADAANLHLPITQKVNDMYETLAQQGAEDLGTQALIQYYLPVQE